MSTEQHIALCANTTILPGLHATLFSLVQNLSERNRVVLTLFVQELEQADLADLETTVTRAGGVGALRFEAADISGFGGLRPLTGDLMPYMRLCLPQLLPAAEKILYLDSDLFIHTDACLLFRHDLGGAALGAVGDGTVRWCIDHAFYEKVGLGQEDRTFNSGVLLFDAELWRQQRLGPRALEFGKTHYVHDQTILNALFSRTFYSLPEHYNIPLPPEYAPIAVTDGIYHFVGSPKPWDLFGRISHGNWYWWHKAIVPARFSSFRFLLRHLPRCLSRTWLLRRSYARTWLRKVRLKFAPSATTSH